MKTRLPTLLVIFVIILLSCQTTEASTQIVISTQTAMSSPTESIPPTLQATATELHQIVRPPTLTPDPSKDPTNQLMDLIIAELGTSNRGKKYRLEAFMNVLDDNSIHITWFINDDSTQELIAQNAQDEVFNMVKIISQSGLLPNYSYIVLQGYYPIADSAGGINEEQVLLVVYERSTVDGIDWDTAATEYVMGQAKRINTKDFMSDAIP